jgi:hypothetical protein
MVGISIPAPASNTMQAHPYDINKVDLALANALQTIAMSMIQFGNTAGSEHLGRVANSYPADDVFTIESVQHIKSESDAVMDILRSRATPASTAIVATVGIVSASAGIALEELNRVAVVN